VTETYDIVKIPDPVLKQVAQPIEAINADIRQQAEKMLYTMYAGAGIGLAANQVGMLNRIFVMDLPDDCWTYGPEKNGVKTIEATYRSGMADEGMKGNPRILINPEILQDDGPKSVYEEGCLSIPQCYGQVVRPSSITVEYLNLDGEKQVEDFQGLHAHCVQHEIDHLNGVLFIDYLSTLKRNMILKKMRKFNKDAAAL
jgi:peptide deformylase